jgi:hypothetical protein
MFRSSTADFIWALPALLLLPPLLLLLLLVLAAEVEMDSAVVLAVMGAVLAVVFAAPAWFSSGREDTFTHVLPSAGITTTSCQQQHQPHAVSFVPWKYVSTA